MSIRGNVMLFSKPKFYRIIEYDFGNNKQLRYGVQFKKVGIWFDVINEMAEWYEVLLFDSKEDASNHIDFRYKYGAGPVTRIVDKIKIGK